MYEVVGGAYRKNNITTMELRFNPMKRNRGGEQDLDHIIAAALRGMDRATLEYPVKPGLIFCLDRAFPYELNEIIAEKAIAWRDRGVVGIDIAGPESATFRVADYKRLFRRARVTRWTMAGKFHKHLAFRPRVLLRFLPDWRMLRFWFFRRRKANNDDSLLSGLIDELRPHGLECVSATAASRSVPSGRGGIAAVAWRGWGGMGMRTAPTAARER